MSHLDNKFRDSEICIIGLGYVGLTLATVMAGVGFTVTGIEIRHDLVDMLNSGKPHFFEPGLEGRLRRAIQENRMSFFKEIPLECKATTYIITIGTPLDVDGKSNMDAIAQVARQVANVLADGDLVILRSTVKIGTTRKIILPILEASQKSFDLAFCPERTLEGKALIELRQLPQIVGGLSPESTIRASQIFQFLTPTVVRVSDIETAEMVKLIDNSNRDIMFAYANEVARCCDAIGISAIEVIQAGKLGYPRTNLPLPGLVGGPCLEKDPYILADGLKEVGVTPEITLTARKINERQPDEIVNFVKLLTEKMTEFPKNPIITLMGLAFKGHPATNDLRGTMARSVLISLRSKFPLAVFRGYDSMLTQEEIINFGLQPCYSIDKAFCNSNLILLLNNHIDFIQMPLEVLSESLAKPSLIYDFWNSFSVDELSLANKVNYISLGSHGEGLVQWKKNYA